jgi:hypothetical protein
MAVVTLSRGAKLDLQTKKERPMPPNRIPGNEPDADDMSTEPGVASQGGAADHDLPEDEAENLGGFA